MFITKLILKGFERIGQNGIDTIEIDFTKDLQIVLGSNGSGKTSLFEQLSLLPPASGEFAKGGYKEAYGHHEGSTYVAISDPARGGHYLEKDGEVLNNWGTASVQKSLIEQHTGLTQEIYDILCTSKTFTSMSATERRDWVMRLSSLDINPLMHIFMTAKTRERDLKGYMNKIAERLKIEERNVVSESLIDDLKESLDSLKAEYSYYSQFSTEAVAVNTQTTDRLREELDILMKKVTSDYPVVPDWIIAMGVKEPRDMEHLSLRFKERITMLEGNKVVMLKTLAEINKVAALKASLEATGIDQCKENISQLDVRRLELHDILKEFPYSIADPYPAKADYLRIFTQLRQEIFELPDNRDYRFNSATYKSAVEKEYGLGMRLTTLKESIYQREHSIKHIDEMDVTVCPSCNFNFKQGVSNTDRDLAVRELENFKEQRDAILKELEELKEFTVDCNDYIARIKSIYSTMSLTPSNEALWVEVRKQEIFKNYTFEAVSLLDNHLTYLDGACELFDTDALKRNAEDVYNKAQDSLNIIRESNVDTTSKIDEDVFALQKEIDKLNRESRELDRWLDRFNTLEALLAETQQTLNDFNESYLKELDYKRAEFIKTTKFNIVKEINSVEQELEQAKVKLVIFKNVEAQHDKAVEEYKEYSTIVANLSPNTGVIADIMTETIDVFVGNLNTVISSVWTSDLKILPCLNKRNDLDWKFPVKVDNGKIRPDVVKTSRSQTDIINLAFQLIIVRYIGLGKYPLYLDELGSSMDDQHRINTMHIVTALIEEHHCSQLFFISHYAAFHEQFTNNETLVLDSKNILVLPKVYNKHAIIT